MFEIGSSVRKGFAAVAFILIAGCVTLLLPKQSKEIVYTPVEQKNGDIIHIATVDPRAVRLELARAEPSNLKTVTEFSRSEGVQVAINAGFFGADGLPVGATKINGTWVMFPAKGRGVFGWNSQGQLFFDRLKGNGRDPNKIKSELVGSAWWEQAENIIGGAPLIIFNGKIIDVAPEQTLQSFLDSKYARTAICVDKNNKLKLVVVEGGDRNTANFGFVGGMSIAGLSAFLLSQGCVHALNLDGGYSSSFVYLGERKNKFKIASLAERAVSTALVVRSR